MCSVSEHDEDDEEEEDGKWWSCSWPEGASQCSNTHTLSQQPPFITGSDIILFPGNKHHSHPSASSAGKKLILFSEMYTYEIIYKYAKICNNMKRYCILEYSGRNMIYICSKYSSLSVWWLNPEVGVVCTKSFDLDLELLKRQNSAAGKMIK